MPYKYNFLTDELDYYSAALTGGDVVTLLEALGGGSRLSHTKLDDIGASDHHTAFVKADADVLYGDIAAVALNTDKVTNATHSGEVTGATELTITPAAVTLAKMANMATASFIGRTTAGSGVPEILSKANALSILNVADGADVTGSNAPQAHTHDDRYYTEAEDNTWRAGVIQAEMDYLDGVTSDIQTQLDARCLESVFGTAISTGLLLDGTDLKASTILQKYHGVDPAANVLSLLGAADYAAMLALLSGEATAAFDLNDQQLSNIKSLAFNDGGATITQVKDEDDMVSDSPTVLSTQQSIKKYVDKNGEIISYRIATGESVAIEDYEYLRVFDECGQYIVEGTGVLTINGNGVIYIEGVV